MREYDVSIIIPCFNSSKYIKDTMESIINQDYDKNKIEVILINDGSIDNTIDILKTYEKENIIVIDKKNEGVSVSRNIGIDIAHGKYILFLDGDDKLALNAIKCLVEFFDKNYDDIDLVTYPIMLFYPNGRKVMHSRYKKLFNKGTGIYDLSINYDLVQATINVMIKNDKTVKFDPNQRYSEDEQFNTKILMKKKKIGYVDNTYYYYRRHNESVTAKKHDEDFEKVYRFHEEFLNEYNNHSYIQSIIMNNMRWRVKEHCIYPNNLSINEINNYVKLIQPRLSRVNYTLFNNENYIDTLTLLEIIALSGIKCDVIDNKLLINNEVVINNIESNNYITKITYENNKFNICGKLQTPYFYKENIKLYSKITYNDGNTKEEEIKLTTSLEYKKYFERNYTLLIDNNVVEITFIMKIDNKILDINTKPIKWCSSKKIYDKYNIAISNKIKIRKKKFIDILKNKMVKCNNLKFYVIELLSIFEKKITIYYGDKNSKLYNLYLNDKSKNKIFITNNNGIKYKKRILKASKIVTDKSFDTVLPFGNLTSKYVQASSFAIEEVKF